MNTRTISALALASVTSFALAQTIVVPSALTNVEGNANNIAPFLAGTFMFRYQQVYNSSEFNALGPIIISGVTFRPDDTFGSPFSTTIPDIQINMSTTSNAADGLDGTSFAANVGANDMIVFARGPLSMSSSYTGAGPKDFDIAVAFTSSFVYDPTQGNLLLDVRNFAGALIFMPFDAEITTGDTVSRVFNEDPLSDAPSIVDSLGLVTQFTYSPVPEPATFAVLGLGALALLRRRKRKAA